MKFKQDKKTNVFIDKCKNKYGDRFDYSKVRYTKNNEKVIIVCPIHGEFKQTPVVHLDKRATDGCPKCARITQDIGRTKTFDYFKKKAILKFGNKYIYHKKYYTKLDDYTIVECPIHGEFKVNAYNHCNVRKLKTTKDGCPECGNIKKGKSQTFSQEEVIKSFRIVHGDRFDYSKVHYVKNTKKVTIVCPIHGEFRQTPKDHKKHGCSKCALEQHDSKGVLEVIKYLDENGILYIREKKFKECRYKLPLRFDFYLYEYDCLIEYDGKQHFVGWYGKIPSEQRKRDEIKNKFTKENDKLLIRIRYDEDVNSILNSYYFK